MMKASKNVHRWRPFVGVIAVGALAFGLSLRLEGAPVPVNAGKATDPAIAVTAKEVKEARAGSQSNRISGLQQQAETVTYGSLANRLNGEIPVMPVIEVDYRDDEATRMRAAGLLVGPLPMPTQMQGDVSVAAVACSFAVQCDDGNPCTIDSCDFPPGIPPTPFGGTCNNTPAPDGQDGSIGDAHCEEHFGLLCNGCDDGVYCNGVESCKSGSCSAPFKCTASLCVGGNRTGQACTVGPAGDAFCSTPCTGTNVCSESLSEHRLDKVMRGVCHAACGSNADCINLNDITVLKCNGDETCSGTICQAGTSPCGSNGLCGEKACRKTGGAGAPPFPDSCTSTNDCIIEGFTGVCDVPGPICQAGRCCTNNGSEPTCQRRISVATCVGGSKAGALCVGNPDCPGGGSCNTTTNCSALGGLFYGTDQGKMAKNDQAGLLCLDDIDDVPFNCPKYSSGIAPSGPFTMLGPISDSTRVNPTFGVALNRLGDDYALSNDPGPGSDDYYALDYLRFVGGMVVVDRISFEIYDASGNFIEDLFFSASATFGLYPVAFKPAIIVPSKGVIVARVASSFSPSARIIWAATNGVDVGSNVNTKLWINNFPLTTVSSSLGVLAFELEGEKATPPRGACCTGASGACDNAVLPWVCNGGVGDVYLGDGVKCATCDIGPENGQYCRRCSNNSAACNKDSDCGGGNTCTTTPPVSFCTGGGTCTAEPACAEGGCCVFGECFVVSQTICETAHACTTGACVGGLRDTKACSAPGDCVGAFLGNGSDCDADNGRDSGQQHCCDQPVSTNKCAGGLNNANACLMTNNCPGGTCKRVCVNGGNPGAFCRTDANCTSSGTCTGAAKCDGGSENNQVCDCPSDESIGTCVATRYSGADDCKDAIVHVITVPPSGETKVITITGDNSTSSSSFANPDSCFPPSGEADAEPGWWEAFTIIDNCAMVRLDFCCNDPVARPTYSIMYDRCPCGPSVFSAPNPYAPSYNGAPEAAFSRGLPYCADDDDLWQSFPLVPAGTYYYPVLSRLSGTHGQYQFHISVQACQKAACCVDDVCHADKNKLECDDLGGFFLGPPNKFPAVACSGANAPCDTGSCCTGPGQCLDIDGTGNLVQPNDCTGGNDFIGGIRCLGGECTGPGSTNPPQSCSIIEDCTGGGTACTEVGAGSLAQPTPCPICEIEGQGNCQLYDNQLNLAVSDWSADYDFTRAEDIRPLANSSLTQVCVWGFYINVDPAVPDAADDCGLEVSDDHFRVRVYTNDAAPPTGNGRMPKTLIAEREAFSEKSERGTLPTSQVETRIANEMYGFQLTIDPPITGLLAGTVYWIEVANDATISGPDTCLWFWTERTQVSTSYSYGGTSAGYVAGFESPFDMTLCTNFALEASTIGALTGACCFCDATCKATTLADCDAESGIWRIGNSNCDGVVCPSTAPANNNCALGAGPTLVVDGAFPFADQCATTDGYGPIPSDTGDTQMDFDLWYKYFAPSACPLVISTCPSGRRFDSMVAVYRKCVTKGTCTTGGGECATNADCTGGNTPPCVGACDPTQCPVCPLDAATGVSLAGTGHDDNCTGFFESDAIWTAADDLDRLPYPGECFLIRVGSFPGSRGTGIISIACGPSGGKPEKPAADPSGIERSRFLSFRPITPAATATAGDTAIRVVLTSLHHVTPVYNDGASIAFTLFEGKSMYVGPPATYIESESSLTPFLASHLQCAAHYRDWSTITMLHVTGEAIVPSSIYNVENLAGACLGVEGSAACVSGGTSVSIPLQVKTGRWGDAVLTFQDPNPILVASQPDFDDIGALVNKFKSLLGAPIKASAKLAGVDSRGLMDITPDVGFDDIPLCVDGFKGKAYPYKPGKCTLAPATACKNDAECGANGPCILCP